MTPVRGTRRRTASARRLATTIFAWFATTGNKGGLNFLDLLRAGHPDYVINAEALAYMRDRALAGPLVARLAEQTERHFADAAAWRAHLTQVGITSRISRAGVELQAIQDPARIATEGALWGSVGRTASWPGRSSSAMTLASSMSATTPCAGSMPSAWCISWKRSPARIAPPRLAFAG